MANFASAGLLLALTASAAAHADDAAQRMLARPLFSAGRRPTETVAAAPSPVRAAPAPRLMGVVVAGGLRQAIFEGAKGRPALVLQVGQRVGAETIHAIGPAGVDLDGASGRRTIRPGHDVTVREAPANAPPPIPHIDPYRRERDFENDQ